MSSPRLIVAALAVLALLVAALPATAARPKAEVRFDRAKQSKRDARVGLGEARAVNQRGRTSATRSLSVVTLAPSAGAEISGGSGWEVGASGGAVSRVEFFVDGDLRWTERYSPYRYGGEHRGFDTTRLANGAHTLTAVAYGGRRVNPGRSTIQVTVDNPVANSPSGDTSLIFSDEFDGASGAAPNPAKWTVMNWCDRWGSLSCNTNRAKNIALDGQGNLRIRAIRENYTDPHGNTGTWTSGRVETQNKFSFTYGTIEARIKVPAGRGMWPAFWTNAATKTGWPATGEIDVMEFLGHDPTMYYCSIHAERDGRYWTKTLGHRESASYAADFHVYEARWTPDEVDFFVDGRPCGTISTVGLRQFTPQQLLLGMAVGGSWPGNPDSSTPSSADMLVDWVRAYK